MLSAPTRSGKGVGVVIPNLLNWPDSVVVLDIKGENFDITAGYRAAARPGGVCLLAVRRGGAQPPLEPADRRAHQPAAPRRRPARRSARCSSPTTAAAPRRKRSSTTRRATCSSGWACCCWKRPNCRARIGELLRQSSGRGPVAEGPPDGADRAAQGRRQAAVGRMRRRAAAAAVELGEHADQHRRDLQRAADDLCGCGGRCRDQCG